MIDPARFDMFRGRQPHVLPGRAKYIQHAPATYPEFGRAHGHGECVERSYKDGMPPAAARGPFKFGIVLRRRLILVTRLPLTGCTAEIKDEQLMLCRSLVRGFCLTRKRWCMPSTVVMNLAMDAQS